MPERDDAGAEPLPRHELHHADGRRLWVYGRLLGRLDEASPRDGHDTAPRPDGESEAASEAAALHQRYDPLTDTWIAISPARNTRPHTASGPDEGTSAGACPLCPGGPEVPFPFEAAVFENRWPSFVREPAPSPDASNPWFAPSLGACEVVVYTSDHEGSLATLSPVELARVLAIWEDRTAAAWSDPRMEFVLTFENRGEAVGATIGHPHGQIYAFGSLPPLIERRVAALQRHREVAGTCLTCTVVQRDAAAPERTIERSTRWQVAVPFAPRWPYEVHVRATRHGARRLTDLDRAERAELSGLLRRAVARYDRLYGFELPYMMAVIEAPAEAPDHHLAVEFWPPHRSAVRMKVRASVETGTGTFINDTVPEQSAATLRAIDVPDRAEAPPILVETVPPGPSAAGTRGQSAAARSSGLPG